MEENYVRKVIMMSLAGLLIGSLLFIFGISIKTSKIVLIVNYIFAIALYLSSFLAVYHNNKKNPTAIFKCIMFIAIVLLMLITYATFVNLM